jgi:hypothetical protein
MEVYQIRLNRAVWPSRLAKTPQRTALTTEILSEPEISLLEIHNRVLREASWNELGELKVRMGLQTREAQPDPGGDDYVSAHTLN